MYQNYDRGLRVLNVDVMIKSLRIAWISRLLSKAIPNVDMFGGLNFLLRCNYYSKFLEQTGMAQFYTSMLQFFQKLNPPLKHPGLEQELVLSNNKIPH